MNQRIIHPLGTFRARAGDRARSYYLLVARLTRSADLTHEDYLDRCHHARFNAPGEKPELIIPCRKFLTNNGTAGRRAGLLQGSPTSKVPISVTTDITSWYSPRLSGTKSTRTVALTPGAISPVPVTTPDAGSISEDGNITYHKQHWLER